MPLCSLMSIYSVLCKTDSKRMLTLLLSGDSSYSNLTCQPTYVLSKCVTISVIFFSYLFVWRRHLFSVSGETKISFVPFLTGEDCLSLSQIQFTSLTCNVSSLMGSIKSYDIWLFLSLLFSLKVIFSWSFLHPKQKQNTRAFLYVYLL